MSNQHVSPGALMLHYNPSTGRIIRVVTVVEVNGEAATVEAVNGKAKGTRYPVALGSLHPADAPES